MITPEKLFAIAADAEAKYKELLKQFPPGTSNKERNDAHRLMEQALICAEWMEKTGLKELRCVGPFMGITLVKGQQVKIAKGAVIRSTHPSRRQSVSNCIQTITVESAGSGYVDAERRHAIQVFQGEVRWAGAGGYWRWTDINNVIVQ